MHLALYISYAMSEAQSAVMTDRKHPDERDEETGRWTGHYTLDKFRAFLYENPLSTTREVEEGVDTSYKTAYRKLHELQDRGEVTSRRAGNAHLWSLTPEGEEIHEEEDR